MNRRVFLTGAVAVAAPLPVMAGSDEMRTVDDLYDAWSAARLEFEHFCDLLDGDMDNEETGRKWQHAVSREKAARFALLSHKDQTLEGMRLRARYINIMVERDHVGDDWGDFTPDMAIFVKSFV